MSDRHDSAHEVEIAKAEEEAAARLADSLRDRQRALRAADATSPYAIRLGASNAPVDCAIFSSDYRLRLPEGDPVREIGGGVSQEGPEADLRAMQAAHRAGLMAARMPLRG